MINGDDDAFQAVPQKEIPAGAGLEYNLQTFNELVAANTAMETEMTSMHQSIVDLRTALEEKTARFADKQAWRGDLISALEDRQQRLDGQALIISAGDKALKEMTIERDYHADNAASLQRKLDRALGYLDAKLDADEGYEKPDPRPGVKPDIGPDLSSIPDAQRRSPNGEGDMRYAGLASTVRFESPSSRRRRY